MATTRGASGGRPYRLLLGCARSAWVSCAIGVTAMVPALALRSPHLVTVFRVALVVAFVALACALLIFACLVAVPGGLTDALPDIRGPSVRRRVEVLFTLVLVDLLEPD